MAVPFFEQGASEIYISICTANSGKVYMATVPSGECKVCHTEHPNTVVKSLETLPDPAKIDR